MRKLLGPTVPLLALPLALAAAGCGAVGFDLSQDIPEQRVAGAPVNPLTGLLPGFLQAPVPITVDLKSETQKRATGPATHVYLTAARLAATPHSSPGGNFDFLTELHIFVEAQQSTGLPRREVAAIKPVPRGQTTIDFTIVPDVDLLPYIQAHDSNPNETAKITATATGTQPAKDFTYDGRITFTIKI